VDVWHFYHITQYTGMQKNKRQFKTRWTFCCQVFVVSSFLFAGHPVYAGSFGGHHGGHHGHSHHGHSGHYDGLGYFFLGVAGIVLLSHILNSSDTYGDRRYKNPYGSRHSGSYHKPSHARVHQLPVRTISSSPLTIFGEDAGWDSLTNGNAKQALDIFAIQSQQNLDSGIPKVGFAIAATVNGDTARGTRMMRKAIRTDPSALTKVSANKNIATTVDYLAMKIPKEIQSAPQRFEQSADLSFMLAALSYLKQDYVKANDVINDTSIKNDQSQSTHNLRMLISKAFIDIE